MSLKKRIKLITIVSAIITFIGFIYKSFLSYMTRSMVLFIAAISTLLILICKILFVKNLTKSRIEKKKAYLFMTISLFLYSLIFVAFVVLKINGIDISNKKTYEGLTGTLFILFMVLTFIMSFSGLKKSLEKTDIMVIGLKEMTFAQALTDLVIIEEFVSRIILNKKEISYMDKINSYFSFSIGILLIIISLVMFIRVLRYKTTK